MECDPFNRKMFPQGLGGKSDAAATFEFLFLTDYKDRSYQHRYDEGGA
jgi:hypothetical protein